MNDVTQVMHMDFGQLFLNVLTIIAAILFVVTLLEKFFIFIGRPIKWIKKNDTDHQLLVELKNKQDKLENILDRFVIEVKQSNDEMKKEIKQQYDSNLQYRDISRNERTRLDGRIDAMAQLDVSRDTVISEISDNLKKLTSLFIDKEISDFRWTIINFATSISSGEKCTQEAYNHCFQTYEKYEKVLEENNLENGQVELSMDVINESYKKRLLEGFNN